MTIKIIKCSGNLYWYKNRIGEKFKVIEDVFDYFNINYKIEKFHTIDGLLINEEDCIIISN